MKTIQRDIDASLHALGLTLPNPPKASGNYRLINHVGNTLYLSGVTCKWDGQLHYQGHVGSNVTIEEAYKAAQITTLNHLAIIKAYLGGFERIHKIIKVTGYVSCDEHFSQIPTVINGSSDLLLQLFGDDGQHARCAVGVQSLPGNAAVETEMVVLLKT
ncbi:RidA family protein [Bacillus tianshenii]|nr:RidA family protein [Bacillus tianshenii]